MESLQLPTDLVEFLDNGRQLQYDPATCEAGAVTLLHHQSLQLRMFDVQCGGSPHEADEPYPRGAVYQVPGVDLIATCTGDYEPEGMLVWLPGERSYGVWDPDHDYLLVFGPSVSWSQIVISPAQYINAQWAFEDLQCAPAEFLVPWHRYSQRKPPILSADT